MKSIVSILKVAVVLIASLGMVVLGETIQSCVQYKPIGHFKN